MKITRNILKTLARKQHASKQFGIDMCEKTTDSQGRYRIDRIVGQMHELLMFGCMTDLAKRIGYSRVAVSRIIHDEAFRYSDEGISLCQAFELHIGWEINALVKTLEE